jgi:hypothetical protein
MRRYEAEVKCVEPGVAARNGREHQLGRFVAKALGRRCSEREKGPAIEEQ